MMPLPPVDRREVLRYAGCREPGPAERELVEKCLEELGDRLQGRVCWDVFSVAFPESGGLDLGRSEEHTSELQSQR